MRAGLLALLLLAGTVAAAILFVKYQLEGLRGRIQQELEMRTGAVLQAGAIDVYGLRGIRIQDFHAEFSSELGHTLRADIPIVYIYIDFLDLLYGELNIERLQMDGANLRVFRPVDQPWISAKDAPRSAWTANPPPFRFTGEDCRVEVVNVVGETTLAFSHTGFDIYHLPEGKDISGRLWGALANDPAKTFLATTRYTSPSEFDVQIQGAGIEAADINDFLPENAHFVSSGTANPFIRVTAYSGSALIVSLKAPFEHLVVRDQPEFLSPASGMLTALAAYDPQARQLTLTTAEVTSAQIGGGLSGTIQFGEQTDMDLRLQVDRLPVDELVQEVLAESVAQYGVPSLTLGEPYTVALRLLGDPKDPTFSLDGRADSATLTFAPAQKNLPAATLDLDGLRLNWELGKGLPEALLSIRGGQISHAQSDVVIERLAGIIKVSADELIAESLQGSFAGNPVVVRGRYNLTTRTGGFEASGVIANIENTLLGTAFPKTSVGGSATVRCSGEIEAGRYMLDFAADATQTRISHDWWFEKPVGVGASLKAMNLEIVPRKRINLSGTLELGTSQANMTAAIEYANGKWQMRQVRGKSGHIDIASLGRCLRVPYALTSGVGTNGFLEWDDVPGTLKASIVKLGGDIDRVTIIPEGTERTLKAAGLHVDAVWDNSNPDNKTGALVIHAQEAALPGFGATWFHPLRPGDMLDEFPEEPRDWTYDLKSAHLSIPPWEGTDFTGAAYSTPSKIGLQQFGAKINAGRIEGSYAITKPDNLSTMDLVWSHVPVNYFLDHLDWPQMMSGDISGTLSYAMDRDDPGTLSGKGGFEVFDGQFSADYLFLLFEKQFSSDLAGLPPSLKFRQLKTDLILDGDVIKTPNGVLQAESLRVLADGQFVTHGDMDYNLRVTLSPETAKRIPVLQDYFNLEGHRFTQTDLELAFSIDGPLFNPSGSVTDLPSVGVTLVSGAAEMTGEAFRVIDLPRQILLDLFKIGGGIVGPPR